MILRNLVLTDENFRQELKNKLVSDRTIKSLTLCNIPRGSSSINLDFLIDNNSDNVNDNVNEEATNSTSNSTSTSTVTGIEELIIERCHIDIDGCKAIGEVLSSSSTKLKSFKMIHVTLLLATTNNNDDDCSCCCCVTPIIDGINHAGRNGWLESIDFQRVVVTATPTMMMVGGNRNRNAQSTQSTQTQTAVLLQLRRLYTSSYKNCINLRSLRLSDCNIGCRTTTDDNDNDGNDNDNDGDDNDDVHELANTIQKLLSQYGKLQSLNLCRNHIDGNGIKILLQSGLSSYHDDHGGSSSSLKRLILSHNPIGDDGAIHLSRFFSSSTTSCNTNTSNSSTSTDLMTTKKTSNTRIESLSLIDCDIWSPGCYILSKELKHFNTLKELIVDGEWENHLDTIIESLSSTNVVLQYLSIHSQSSYDDNEEEEDDANNNEYTIIDQQWKQIEYYLALNRAKLRRLSTKQNLSFALWPTVLENTNKKKKKNGTTTTTRKNKDNSNTNLYADVWYDVIRRRPELMASVSTSST